jgi:hypothetical protein
MKQQQDRTVEQFVEYNKDKQAMGKVRRQFKVLLFSSFIILTFVLFCDFCLFVCLFFVPCPLPLPPFDELSRLHYVLRMSLTVQQLMWLSAVLGLICTKSAPNAARRIRRS